MKIKLVSDTLLKHRVKELKKFIDNNFEGEVTKPQPVASYIGFNHK